MYESNVNGLGKESSAENTTKGYSYNMDDVARKVATNLEMSGKDGRIVSQNRDIFDKEFLAEVSGGASFDRAWEKAVGAVTLDLAKE